MAPVSKKRNRLGNARGLTKRQKLESDGKKRAKHTAKAEVISLDELTWKEVALPDRLEDAEGFFGLEEIEDVAVVKDEHSGKIEYRVASGRCSKPDTHQGDHAEQSDAKHATGHVDDDSNWEGFEEDDKVEQPKYAKTAPPVSDQPSSKNKQGKTRLQPALKEPDIQSHKQGNVFDVLEDSDDDGVDVSAWSGLGLSQDTLLSLAKLRFSKPTPIQLAAIPEILKGYDVIGKASTGSGKTLAFGIPILEHFLLKRYSEDLNDGADRGERRNPPVAMILSPTRELAHQLSTHLTSLCSNVSGQCPRIATLTGGLSLLKQQRLLKNADIVIGTPGRLWEVISSEAGLLRWLRQIKFLIADEADRLLSEGHFKEVEEILNSLDREDVEDGEPEDQTAPSSQNKAQRQTLVFSATFQRDLQRKLAGKGKANSSNILDKQESMDYLFKKLNFRSGRPKFIDVNPMSQMAINLKEGVVECSALEKDLYLYALLLHYPKTRTLIFANSISAVRRLTPFLQNLNIPAHGLHSQMPQKARLRSVERFASPAESGSILVATDVAARGLDIPAVQLVLHYHLPRAADMYVHRSGRTARAENSGTSILICAPEEVVPVRRLIAKVHAQASHAQDPQSKFYMRTLDLDRRLIARLKPRVALSKKISDAFLAKEKQNLEGSWLRTAADEFGVEYDSGDFEAQESGGKGRGQGRKKAQKQARELSRGELDALRAELKVLLSQRVNVGVSERYLSAGGLDPDELLRQGDKGEFLGKVDELDFD